MCYQVAVFGLGFSVPSGLTCEKQSGWACQHSSGPAYLQKRRELIFRNTFSVHLGLLALSAIYSFFPYSLRCTHTSEIVPVLENFLYEVEVAAILSFSTHPTSTSFSHLLQGLGV